MLQIQCTYYVGQYMVYTHSASGVATPNKPDYQPVIDFKYCPVLGSFNNCNSVTFSNKTTTYEPFEEIHKVVLGVIGENMDSLVQTGNYGVMNKKYLKTMVYYVVKYVLDA